MTKEQLFLRVCEQVQRDYQIYKTEYLVDFVIGNMQRTFGAWWSAKSHAGRGLLIRTVRDHIYR